MRRLGATILLALAYATPSLAWGTDGHQIIATIAARELTPAARTQVGQLLGGNPTAAMIASSMWADEIRPQRRETAPWHYVDIPVRASGYVARRDCAGNDCIVAQIEREIRIVGDRSLLTPVRTEALRFLIHFVGDIHQPLHAADNDDRGGNQIRVQINRRRTNMHAVWDTDVVEALGGNPVVVANRLEADMSAAKHQSWQSGTPADWANETFHIAVREIYATPRSFDQPGLVILPRDYPQRERGVTEEQLSKAGVTLASVLNRIFP